MKATIFSLCKCYRYTLWREWDMFNSSHMMFIGLNPSTADEIQNDPTVRRCIGYAKRWGFGALVMMNIFAYRATNPAVMKSQTDPIGPDNDLWLTRMAKEADLIVAAWGINGVYLGRGKEVVSLFEEELFCLGVTKDGHPRHPLYLSKDILPSKYKEE